MRFSAFSLAIAGIVAATLVVSGSALAVTFIPRDVPGAAQEIEPIGLQPFEPLSADLTTAPSATEPTPSAVPAPEVEDLGKASAPTGGDGNSGVGVGNGGGNGTGNEGEGNGPTDPTGPTDGNGNGQGNNGNGTGNGGGNGTGNEGEGNGPNK